MNLLPTDIIKRNHKDGETLWLSQRLVMEVCGISEEYFWLVRNKFKKSIQKGYKYGDFLPNTGASWRWGKANGTFYYDYDCLPDRKPTFYRSKLGVKAELIKAFEAMEALKINQKTDVLKSEILRQVQRLIDYSDSQYFMFKAMVGFNKVQADQMATARAWCTWMHIQLANDNFKKLGFNKVQDFYQTCTELIAPLELEGFKIKSAAYLRNKLNEYPITGDLESQLNFFVSRKYGNDNAKIVGATKLVDETTGEVFEFDYHKAIMLHLYMNPGDNSKEYLKSLHDQYIDIIKRFEQEPVSYRTFCIHLGRFGEDILKDKARHGMDWYRKNVMSYVPIDKLKKAHSLFCGDGSGTINYKFRRPDGKLTSMKIFVMLITDVASRAIVGFSVAPKGSHNETESMLKEAVKMAIETGGNQTMFEFVSDNAPAFSSAESKSFLSLVFNKVRRIEPGNSQANPAEIQFKLFKNTLKDQFNFISSSWGSGINGQSNPDGLRVNELPEYEDAVIQLFELIKKWNNTPLSDGVTPKERFANKNEACRPLEPVVLRQIFGNHTKRTISNGRGFVLVETSNGYHDRNKYLFEIPEYGGIGSEMIAKATGYVKNVEVKVVWDETMADLYTLDGKFIMSCPRAVNASNAFAENSETQQRALEHHLGRKKRQVAQANEFEKKVVEIGEALGLRDLPYSHAMALGSNKEVYNESMVEVEATKIKNRSIKKAEKYFDDTEWTDLNTEY